MRLDDLLRDGDISANVAMRPGDVVIIPETFFEHAPTAAGSGSHILPEAVSCADLYGRRRPKTFPTGTCAIAEGLVTTPLSSVEARQHGCATECHQMCCGSTR